MKKIQPIYVSLLILVLFYAFSSNPPNGRTGAPGEGNCTDCHIPGNASFDGTVAISGLPNIIIPSTTYQVSVITKALSGSPVRAGFQMVVLDGANNNAGNFSNAGASSTVSTENNKNYFEHNPAVNFNGIDSVIWTVDWTAPATIGSDSVKIYINSMIASGGGNDNDFMASNQSTFAFQVAVADPIEITIIESNDLSCFGANDGVATISASGGTGSFTYQWSNDSTTTTISNLSIGNYVVTVTDTDDSTATATITINQPDEIVLSIDSLIDITCSNPVGNAKVMVSGGLAPYSYEWSTNVTTQTASLSSGMHDVTVTDANQCTNTITVTITEDLQLPEVFAGFDVTITCADTNTTSTQLEAFNTTTGPVVSYLWTTEVGNIVSGDTTLSPVVDAAGTYVLTVLMDENGCSTSDTVLVSFNTADVIADAGTDQQLNCDNATVTLGGNGNSTGENIIYNWTTIEGNLVSNEVMPSVTNTGMYVLTVRDTLTNCSAMDSVVITSDATIPEVTVGMDIQIDCGGNDTILVAGNATMGENIIYEWITVGGEIIGDTTTLQTTIVGTGTYSITATDTLNTCSATASFSVTNATPPTADAGSGGEINCMNPNLLLDASNSVGTNLIYVWTTTDGNIIEGATSPNPKVDAAGTYNLTITDTLTGCVAIASVGVTQGETGNLLAASGDAEQLTCIQSSLILNATAAEGENIIYEWTTESGNIVEGGNTLTPVIDAPGRYFLMVRDTISGCTGASSINIAQDINLPTVSAGETQVLDCNNTSVTLNGSSDTQFNLTYTWTTENGTIDSGENTPNPLISTPGTYTLTVLDTFTNCSNAATVTILQDAALPMANAGTTMQLDCNNDTLTLAGSGSSGDNFTSAWTTENGSLIGDLSGFTPMVNTAGIYTLSVTDTTSGCSSTASVTIISDRELPMVEVGAAEQSFCDNSTLSINATASEGDNFTYFWCTTEGNILEGGETTNVVINGPGLFEFIVTNTTNGCKTIDSVLVSTFESPEISLDTTNDTTILVVSGNIEDFIFTWLIDSILPDSFPITLVPGNYNITITDENGCSDEIAFIIEDTSTNLETITASIETLQVFPNPANAYFNINLDFKTIERGTIFLINKVGQQVWQRSFVDKHINMAVDVTDLSAGIYFMVIETEKGVKTEEVVVIK